MNMESKKYLKNGYKKIYPNNRDLPPIIKPKSCMRQFYQQKQRMFLFMSFIKKFLTPFSEEIVRKYATSESRTEPVRLYPLNSSQKIINDFSITSNEEDSYTESTETNSVTDLVNVSSNIQSSTSDKTECLTIASYFKDNGIELIFSDTKDVVAPVESLAFSIAINYPRTKTFIRFLRDCITKKAFDFTYSIASFSMGDKNAIVSLAERLNEYGLISNYFYNKNNNTIKGTISSCPRCINFINGDFLELYAKSVTVSVIKKAADKYNNNYEFYHNVHITKDAEKHELDIIFRIGDQVFWGEIKSGDFDADKYRKIGIMMGVVPHKLILLATEKSNDAAIGISHFYEYYCANINTFKNTLIEMIDKAFEEEK